MAKNQSSQDAQNASGQNKEKTLSHREALTAEMGNDTLKRARELGYEGYVWQEDKSEYTQMEVTNNDQIGPNKSVEDDHDFMEDNFIRPDKMDESKK